MMKIDVNGEKQNSLYGYLTKHCLAPSDVTFDKGETFWSPITLHDISWNFEKILVDRKGRPRFRFQPGVEPNDIKDIIKILLENSRDEYIKIAKAFGKLDQILLERKLQKEQSK